MFTSLISEFADRLVDELAPLTADEGTAEDSPRLIARLDRLSHVGVDDAEVLAALVETARLRNLVDAVQTQLVSAASRIGIPGRKKLRSPAALLTEIGVPPAVAYRTVRNGVHADALPAVAQGMRDGSLAPEKADAVGRGVDFVQKRVPLDDETKVSLTRKLLAQDTPGDIDKRAREFAIAAGGDGAESDAIPVAENAELNEMTLSSNDEGRLTAEIDLDVLTGEELSQALDPLMQPVAEADGSPDKRSGKQRRADAFGQIVRAYLSRSDRPTSGGVLPHATLVIPAGRSVGGSPPIGRSPVASTVFTGPVSTATVALVLCDSAISAVTVDATGAPLHVGREQRLFTSAMRRALLVRDQCCARPGCGRPASWCDIHHVVPWSEGGETGIENGVLLCRRCHTLVHHGGWTVFIGDDGHPWFVPPADGAGSSNEGVPIRSHARRTLTIHETADAA
ncbi:HNH endonuclease signature motif containing protein [Gordonia humi]|uniref:HNH nuclease domain-containing protein n=1 Tax=Gordonia humi TaxID=686429 RepID=A0A840EZ33_9ACTN|nr:HNH endonuclease signature motif containing protein [Gordonia humi]MBB4136841.1 hypothetical protein [Gordonia humi]